MAQTAELNQAAPFHHNTQPRVADASNTRRANPSPSQTNLQREVLNLSDTRIGKYESKVPTFNAIRL